MSRNMRHDLGASFKGVPATSRTGAGRTALGILNKERETVQPTSLKPNIHKLSDASKSIKIAIKPVDAKPPFKKLVHFKSVNERKIDIYEDQPLTRSGPQIQDLKINDGASIIELVRGTDIGNKSVSIPMQIPENNPNDAPDFPGDCMYGDEAYPDDYEDILPLSERLSRDDVIAFMDWHPQDVLPELRDIPEPTPPKMNDLVYLPNSSENSQNIYPGLPSLELEQLESVPFDFTDSE